MVIAMGSRWPGELGALKAQILEDGRISADDVLLLRRAIYSDGELDREEAEFLFHLHHNSRDNDPAWAEFFVEALTGFYYWQEGSESCLTPEAEDMLLTAVGPEVDDATELRLLLSLIFRTHGASDRFRQFVMDAVRRSVLHSDHALYRHAGRRPGAIDAADVEIIRKLVYGMGSHDGYRIGQVEAEFLFALNAATAGAPNHPAWRDLFVKATTMYLLFAGESPDRVDEVEARWLLHQIGAGERACDNERALLAYLKHEASFLHPLLDPLCQRLGV